MQRATYGTGPGVLKHIDASEAGARWFDGYGAEFMLVSNKDATSRAVNSGVQYDVDHASLSVLGGAVVEQATTGVPRNFAGIVTADGMAASSYAIIQKRGVVSAAKMKMSNVTRAAGYRLVLGDSGYLVVEAQDSDETDHVGYNHAILLVSIAASTAAADTIRTPAVRLMCFD